MWVTPVMLEIWSFSILNFRNCFFSYILDGWISSLVFELGSPKICLESPYCIYSTYPSTFLSAKTSTRSARFSESLFSQLAFVRFCSLVCICARALTSPGLTTVYACFPGGLGVAAIEERNCQVRRFVRSNTSYFAYLEAILPLASDSETRCENSAIAATHCFSSIFQSHRRNFQYSRLAVTSHHQPSETDSRYSHPESRAAISTLKPNSSNFTASGIFSELKMDSDKKPRSKQAPHAPKPHRPQQHFFHSLSNYFHRWNAEASSLAGHCCFSVAWGCSIPRSFSLQGVSLSTPGSAANFRSSISCSS